eukprot:COSAG01_NODE_6909_length_3443_cov_13.005981_1_plen_116_part_00
MLRCARLPKSGRDIEQFSLHPCSIQFTLTVQYLGPASESEFIPIPTLDRDTVSDIHDDIRGLYEEAIELLENPDVFQFEYYERRRGPLQVAMDALVLLYIWGQHPTHTNDRRLPS